MVKKMLRTMTLAMMFALGCGTTAMADTLKISVETTSDQGNVIAKIYVNQDTFDKRESVTSVTVPAKPGLTELEFKDVKPGIYGVTVFHDRNENGELDRNFIRAPTEPFGFSNDPVIRFAAPEFDEFKFEFDGSPKAIRVKFNGE